MGDLVIGDGERPGGHGVQVLHSVLGVDLQEPGAPQGAVDVDGALDPGDPVLGEDHDRTALGPCLREERREDGVERGRGPEGARVAGAVALEVVVQVRDVAEGEVGAAAPEDVTGGVDDPAAGDQIGAGAPEVEEGKVPNFSVSSSCRAGGRV